MVERLIFRAQCRPGRLKEYQSALAKQNSKIKDRISQGEILTLCISAWGSHVFLYYECRGKILEPHELLENGDELLEPWPGEAHKRFWVPMMDIYHYNAPASLEHWRRKEPVGSWLVRIARLKPEMVSSYIFYHYQLQEEKPGQGNKYGIIAIHENLLYFYMEEPEIVEVPPHKGKLRTANSPKNWGEVMCPHFIEWPKALEGQEIWKNADVVLAL